MPTLRLILGDQLNRAVASLRDINPATDIVMLCEVAEETDYVPHHPKKIAFLFSAMRHFAAELTGRGIRVRYVRLDDPANSGSFTGELRRAVAELRPDRVVVTEPGEYRVLEAMRGWPAALGRPVEIRDDDRFFCSTREFAEWARGKQQLRMEFFYREMRKRTGLLMAGPGQPEGGRWNYDEENRRPPQPGMRFAGPARFEPDEITCAVLELVGQRFAGRFGALEPFRFGVTRGQALAALDHFVETALADFGAFQDAMLEGEDWLHHSLLSQYMNCGLLLPREVCERVAFAYAEGQVPLNSAEGYIRQILGWREYVRGVYWLKMPDYARLNHLEAKLPLPDFYWTGKTRMNCLHRVIDQTRREAHSHHIQRLMVTGNFALLIGVLPAQICLWYLAVYVDAYEWVELPNTAGMVMYADGGFLASKPYVAGGNYINRMSDFCRGCAYDVRRKAGPEACPFNYLYWNFLIENRPKLRRNQRLQQVYRTLDRMTGERQAEIVRDSQRFLASLEPWRSDAYD